jgi:hypothetical protein
MAPGGTIERVLRARKRRVFAAIGIVLLVAAGALALHLGDGDENAATATTVARTPVKKALIPQQPRSNRLAVEVPAGADAVLYVRDHHHVRLMTARQGGRLVADLRPSTAFGSRTTLAVVGVHGKWAQVITPDLPNGQFAWVKLDRRRLGDYATYARIDVDLSTRRATLYVDGKPARSFAVTIGAPGTDTPAGRFAVTDTFRGLHNPSYGCCALALSAHQPFLPSGWLGGDRIAIHGTYETLGAAISHGCVRAANPDVRYLVAHAPIGSQVDVHA